MAHQIAHVLRFTHSPTRRFSDSALWPQPLALSPSKRSEDPACCEAAAGHWEKAMIQGPQKPRFSDREVGFFMLKACPVKLQTILPRLNVLSTNKSQRQI